MSDEPQTDGFVETLFMYAYDCKLQSCKGQKDKGQNWIALTQEEYDNPKDAKFSIDRMLAYSALVKRVAPGQVFRILHNEKTGQVRGHRNYVGLFGNDEIRQDFRRQQDELEQAQEERKLMDKDRKDDPFQKHFDALATEYKRRHGAAKRAFMLRVIYEVFG